MKFSVSNRLIIKCICILYKIIKIGQNIKAMIIKTTLYLSLFLTLCFTLTQTAPDHFSWDNVNGITYLSEIHSQNYPQPCHSGWAFAAVDVFNSRMKIKRKAASPDIQIGVQVLLSCDQLDYGCMGGQVTSAFRWIKKNNITDSSCSTYLAKGYTNGVSCTSQSKCQTCLDGSCKSTINSKIYAIDDYGTVSGQANMIDQILKYGPVACGINSTGLNNYTSGIIKNNNNTANRIDHFVVVYGWGIENGTQFWRVRNSWGSSFGENGTFRIQRGKNVLGIQNRCSWASPLDTWTNDIRNKTVPNNPLGSYSNISVINPSVMNLPQFLTASRSSVTPHECTSSWAFATVSMIADRQYIKTAGKHTVKLSVQSLLNCGVGKCAKGGTPIDALIFIDKYGLAEQGCQYYQGVDPSKQNCSGISNCGNCVGSVFEYKCTQSKNYKRWKISDYGYISGETNMKNQIYNGPIVCGIHASEEFKKYKGGIFSEISINPKVDHYVEVVGYGSEGGKNYWLARNFWGTAWGESSFVRILMGKDNLGLETKCYFSKGLL